MLGDLTNPSENCPGSAKEWSDAGDVVNLNLYMDNVICIAYMLEASYLVFHASCFMHHNVINSEHYELQIINHSEV